MHRKIIYHQSQKLEWITPNQIADPHTLVLGSFNPFNENGNNVDYYYGRKNNFFWKVISQFMGYNEEDYFFNNPKRKLDVMHQRFCCLDMINSIEFSCDSIELLESYIADEVLSNFGDQKIWAQTARTNNDLGPIVLRRSYNQTILQLLRESTSIKKVIHTMGKNMFKNGNISPKEKKLKNEGFESFVKEIQQVCEEKKIKFIQDSVSPSAYAVKKQEENLDKLRNFLKDHLNC